MSLRRIAVVLLTACAAENTGPGAMCAGDKCDLPDDPADVLCGLRRGEALSPNQHGFTAGALRWSCNDARGVTGADRGQEYCEYFAVVQLGDEAPRILGRNLGADAAAGTTATTMALAPAQLAALEADSAAVVGQCVFTSWNSDVTTPVAPGTPPVAGVVVSAADFRMRFEVNSAEAAQLLVADCAVTDAAPASDPFTRACLYNDAINATSFRKSDTTVCAAALRIADCGCTLPGGASWPAAISPAARRGFPLGTWSSPGALPPSCRFVDPGDGSQTIVTCDLTAGDLLAGVADPKERCRDRYADNVVVHVPMPAEVTCSPSCAARPWML